jgi:hypothetical protein
MSHCTAREWIKKSKYDATKSGTEHDLDRAPGFASEHVQVTCERDTRQKVSEEDIDSAGKDQLVENSPVRNISPTQVNEVLLHKAKGT